MVTVHGLLPQGRSIPAAYGPFPGKTQILYTNLFQQLNSEGPFFPETILTDYEKGLQNAILSIWPNSSLRGCYFHFKQCLWRKLSTLDLVP
ncbi:uncharacterized protein FKW44_007327 [Caligus rogercresseyi]|uniref:MULE transposase domain-containing protein n=1 Tax=Caligus rogercresseyi TaxID=217165 RepID=A0A7T8KEK4_CALRO|nr:uncharacterized protein FKW44_007327 [Caligus rogercresseyi]